MAEPVRWVTVATYASAFEADIAVATLEARGVPARTRSNDIVGIFGPGFGGATARGVDVLVLAPALHVARTALASSAAAAADDDETIAGDEAADEDDEQDEDDEARP